MTIRKTSTWQTPLFADAIEFCPINGFHDIFAVGTYQLQEEQVRHEETANESTDEKAVTNAESTDKREEVQVRDGAIHLRKTVREADSEWSSTEVHSTATSGGVLDMKWFHEPINSSPMMAVATSTGIVSLLQVRSRPDTASSQHTTLEQSTTVSNPLSEQFSVPPLALSLSLSQTATATPSIATCYSSGHLAVLTVTPTSLNPVRVWKAHELETWCVSFGTDDGGINTVLSGADDALIKMWDVREGSSRPLVTVECHSSGVTSISPYPNLPYFLSTSYDQHVMLHDVRVLGTSGPRARAKSVVCDLDMSNLRDGTRDDEVGAWRSRWHPTAYSGHGGALKGLAALALMRGGWSVVDVDVLEGKARELCRWGALEEVEGSERRLAYGVDWSWDDRSWDGKVGVVGACSFYDRTGDLVLVG
ncbi:hypothetical protein M427DRAFT_57455 [Gonapodya prolifera JEL478]|uniref:methylated diphthine methylhydrolase n=1 Tax=Gonapodya prolifera (strain JEL478) TaxID=1344416 RepID=A0A139ACZ8_GONPJ|nr:hypothetical protein M427DRAFT_57455 [Gonapodya prolifera JEL478]|eukprot:KXS14539.1 hypothetical protein M427DRAFT_57455 [Gonapodya prolifera JEL478]